MSDQCNGCPINAENLHLRMYAPARRATQNTDPVKAIGKCNTAYWFGPGYTEDQEAAIDADDTGELTGWHPIDED